MQEEGGRESTGAKSVTSRTLGSLEQELSAVKSIAKCSQERTASWHDFAATRGEENAYKGTAKEEGVASTTKPGLALGLVEAGSSKKQPLEASPANTEFMSPMSRGFESTEASPAVDFTQHKSTSFTPGKYTIKERLQLLQDRFSRLNQNV